jgi:hypothetical protein
MNRYIKQIIGVVFLGLVAINIFIFLNGVNLSNDVHFFESEIHKLQQENMELEKKVYKVESLMNTASIAAELGYTSGQPVYLEKPGYAMR